MASMTMAAASLLPNMTKMTPSSSNGRRGSLMVVKASSSNGTEGEKVCNLEMKNNGGGRRELVFAAAAAAMAGFSVAKVAMAEDEEPKAGTPEAKKKYAPICVTMPTARVCRK